MDIWLLRQRYAFAIKTGQIEDLYQLRRGIIEIIITEDFDNVQALIWSRI